MTSETPPRVSVRDRAREIEARRFSSPTETEKHADASLAERRRSRSLTPARNEESVEVASVIRSRAPGESQLLRVDNQAVGSKLRQESSFIKVVCASNERRCSEGDLIGPNSCPVEQRSKPSSSTTTTSSHPPEVPPRVRRFSCQNGFAVLRLSGTSAEPGSNRVSLDRVEEERGSGSKIEVVVASGSSKYGSFKSGSRTWEEGRAATPLLAAPHSTTTSTSRDVAIFSNPCCNNPVPFSPGNSRAAAALPALKNGNPLEEIIASLERICDEFDSPDGSSEKRRATTHSEDEVSSVEKSQSLNEERSVRSSLHFIEENSSPNGISSLHPSSSHGAPGIGRPAEAASRSTQRSESPNAIYTFQLFDGSVGKEYALDNGEAKCVAPSNGRQCRSSYLNETSEQDCRKKSTSSTSSVFVSSAVVQLSVVKGSSESSCSVHSAPRGKQNASSAGLAKVANEGHLYRTKSFSQNCSPERKDETELLVASLPKVFEQKNELESVQLNSVCGADTTVLPVQSPVELLFEKALLNNNYSFSSPDSEGCETSTRSSSTGEVKASASIYSEVFSGDSLSVETTEAENQNNTPNFNEGNDKHIDEAITVTNGTKVVQRPSLPPCLSFSRKSLADVKEHEDVKYKDRRSGSLSVDTKLNHEPLDIKEAKSILAGLDFGKYRRKRNEAENGALTSGHSGNESTMEGNNSTPLKSTRSPKSSNAKLRELLDVLKPHVEASVSRKKPFLITRTSSFTNAETVEGVATFYLGDSDSDVSQKNSYRAAEAEEKKTSTLPRRKSPSHRPIKRATSPMVAAVCSCPSIVKLDSEANQGLKQDADEGLVSDSEAGSGSYVTAYVSCITSPPIPRKNVLIRRSGGHVRSSSDDVTASTTSQALIAENLALKPGVSLELSSPYVSANTPDKRKRRKGVGSMMSCNSSVQCGGASGSGQEPVKSGTGRSLTYPPQRKTSLPEDGQDYTSVDSNGLKSLKMLSPGLLEVAQDEHRLLSDLSLADSHLCPSEGMVEETYQDVVDSVIRSPDDQHLFVENSNVTGNGKLPKKKHHSDPGGDISSGVAVEGVVFLPDAMIGSSRSEPDLGANDTIVTSPSCSSTSSASSNQHTSLSHHRHPEDEDDGRHHLRLTAAETHGGSEPPGSPRTHGSRHVRVGSGGCISASSRFQFDFDADRQGIEPSSSKSPQEQRRYSKRRLRGPYGEMLEEEMRKSGEKTKPNFNDLSFLQEICETTAKKHSSSSDTAVPSSSATQSSRTAVFASSQSLDDGTSAKNDASAAVAATPKRKISANYPLLADNGSVVVVDSANVDGSLIKRSSSSCSQDSQGGVSDQKVVLTREKTRDNITNSSVDGLTELTKTREKYSDTRTHVVAELYDTEKSYVESLEILVNKYMKPLKSPEYNGVIDTGLVDEIFFQIPDILAHHEDFLEELRQRLSSWDSKQKVGDVFVEAFTKQQLVDTYTSFINNWKSAKDAIKIASQAKPAFARFLEHMTREHKGKLTLDALLIMPVQRIPRYELLIKELLKHTHVDHPDHRLLVAAQRELHELAVKINRMEREAFQHEQMQQRLKDIEQLIDGVLDLAQPDRGFIRHDMVNMPGGLGTKKERCLFLFTDLLLITSMKRKSGTMRKPSATSTGSPNALNSLEMNKYKLLTKFSLDNLDITRSTDNNLRRLLKDIENLEEDAELLNQITELTSNLNIQHQVLDEAVKELVSVVTKQLAEKQNTDSQLVSMELTVTTQEGIESLTILFSSPERRATWEAAFNEAKQKLALFTDRRPPPEFMHPLPIRKTRAGLQFTCATATLGLNQQGLRDVWVCNSDGYVGQVCVLSLQPEPTVMSCNGVCNARILTIASIPAAAANTHSEKNRWRPTMPDNLTGVSIEVEECDEEFEEQRTNNGNIELDSDSSDEEDESESPDDEKQREGRKQRGGSLPREDGYDDMDHRQPTMWLGTEDGCILLYNCNDNIRTKKNKIKIQHPAAIHCIIYLDNRVFVALSNGEVHVYKKDVDGGWSSNDPQQMFVGSVMAPVTKMLAVAGKLWCGCQNIIKVVNTTSLQTENSFSVSNDSSRTVLCMVTSGLGVWVALQHSAVLRLFHATTYEGLLDVNVSPAVTKMLAGCDDIIRQHKAACLRVTAMLSCKDLLWVGTSAGVILTLPLPHLTSATTRLDSAPNVAGLPHGHTGHVRFLTCVEMGPGGGTLDGKVSRALRNKELGTSSRRASVATSAGCKLLVISGGDGYEDFRNCGLGEAAGRDDSTNHLLLWQV